MIQKITAVYEDGRLRPLGPLNLREHQEVMVTVMPVEEDEALDLVVSELVAIGALTLPHREGGVGRLSEEDLEKLAERISKTTKKPLSEIIIEERGEW